MYTAFTYMDASGYSDVDIANLGGLRQNMYETRIVPHHTLVHRNHVLFRFPIHTVGQVSPTQVLPIPAKTFHILPVYLSICPSLPVAVCVGVGSRCITSNNESTQPRPIP